MDAMRERYTEEQMKQFAEVGRQVPETEQRAIEPLWAALIAEVRLAHDLDPATEAARALADRWNVLTERTAAAYRDHPELLAAIRANYEADRFADVPDAPRPEDFAFIARVNAARA